MDSTEVTIARLVLGYLKSEKCRSAYKEFLRTSTNLQDAGLSKCKYVPTRFIGLTLEDVLSEYFEISKIVQGRLEATNYYSECHSKDTLVEQLLYLLNKVHLSRTSTPCPRSPPESNLDATSPSHIDPISDVETTPVHALPGNIRCSSENSYLHKGSRRKLHSKYNKSDTIAIPVTNKEDMSEVLAQTLLENREFHEKIAQTINKVAEKQYRVSGELDKTIKTIVRETEEDPIFDKILDEIIGSTTIIDANKNIESGSTSSSTVKNNSEQYETRLKKAHKYSSFGENQNYIPDPDSKTVEEQNNEAIQSIIANARLVANTQTDNQENPSNNEVIVFDGSLDKYLVSNPCNANTQTQPIQNPLYLNASGNVLMVPSAVSTNVTGNIQIDSTKQYYFVNKQVPVGWNIPTIKTPSVITEQDILSMPTVIVNDDKQTKLVPSHSLLQTPVLTTVKSTLQSIIPKPTIEIPAGYTPQCTTTAQSTQTSCKPEDVVQRPISPITKAKTNTGNVKTNAKSLPSDLLTENHEEVCEVNKTCQQKVAQSTKDVQVKTPDPPIPVSKSTPKSGSHVRNLDFSTPPKITSTQKKILKSNRNKTPPFVHKKQAAKTLFKPRDNTDVSKKKKNNLKEDVEKKRKLPASDAWDADLRASVAAGEAGDNQTPKKKQKMCESKRVIKKQSKKGKLNSKLNTTEQDAALLEAALKTPIKGHKNNESALGVESKIEESEKKIISSNKDSNKSDIDNRGNTNVNATEGIPKKCENLQGGTNVTDDNSGKTILSPSKLNANKRNFVTDLTAVDKNRKFITPEMVKENFHHPITHAKNITLLLDTPLKADKIPKTPGSKTPMDSTMDPNLSLSCSIFTPLSRMLEANLKDIDINSIETPGIPLTPSFPPFTPTIDLISPYPNRPTDYSTSSSYYQPSDSEQNKSLEANVMELEKKPINIHSDILITKEDNLICADGKAGTDVSENNKETQHATNVNEHLNIFNKNVIGKKNLNLMKRDMSSSSSSSGDDSSSSASNEDADRSNDWESDSNKTIIQRRSSIDTPKRTYSLRNRTTTINNEGDQKKKSVPPAKKQSTKNIKTKQPDTSVKQDSVQKEEKKEVPNESVVKLVPDNNALPKKQSTKNIKTKQPDTSVKQDPVQKEEKKEVPNASVVKLVPDNSAPPKKQSTKNIKTKQPDTSVKQDSVQKEEKKEVPNENVVKLVPYNSAPPKKQSTKNTKTKQPDTSVKQDSVQKEEKKEVPNERVVKLVPDNSAQQSILKELEEKRLRTINKVKDTEKEVHKKTGRQHGKFIKIKPIPNLDTRRKPRKSDSPKKTVQKTTDKMESKTQIVSRNDLYEKEYKKDDTPPQTNISEDENKCVSQTNVDESNKITKKIVQKTTEKNCNKTQGISKNEQERKCEKDIPSRANEDEGEKVTNTPVDKCFKIKKSEKSPSDVEAQNLIEGLKERGIHLMHNKSSSPTKKDNESVLLGESNADGDKTKDDSLKPIEHQSTKNCSYENNISGAKETNLSTSEIESEIRDVFDTCVFENENEHVIFDETKVITRVFTDFDMSILTKTFLGKVFVEEYGEEMDVPLMFTPLNILLDIPASEQFRIESTITIEQGEMCNKIETFGEKNLKESDLIRDVCNTVSEEILKSDDDLMNYAIVGSIREKTPDDSDSPKSAKKRKTRSEENSHTEKKCKTLLKKINVDSFLNNIHGGT